MPRLGPIKRSELIRLLRRLGFRGPRPGGKHQYMSRGLVTLRIPNPHRGDIDIGLLNRLLRQAGVTKTEWEQL
jgi:predicted RNA binding protein YcfA (HicA-like mRNA interferase family)